MNDLQTLPQSPTLPSWKIAAPPRLPQRRDRTIDTLRGLAIFTMIAANLAAQVLADPHPFWLRVYGSFAAPLFVVLAGMMVVYGTRRKGYRTRHFVVRGAVLIALAAMLDMLIWDSFPFLSMDVLYLIGVSLPLAYLTVRLDAWSRCLMIATVFLSTPLFQHAIGYADYPVEVSFVRGSRAALAPTDFIHHWLIDGWFPLFPWFGFVLFGVQLADYRSPHSAISMRRYGVEFCIGLALLAGGIVIWRELPGSSLVRAGYSELFYPPTLGFIVTSLGVVVTLLAVIDWKPDLACYRLLQRLGESALTIYVAHLIFIDTLVRYVKDVQLLGFAMLYAGTLASMLMLARAEQALQARWWRTHRADHSSS